MKRTLTWMALAMQIAGGTLSFGQDGAADKLVGSWTWRITIPNRQPGPIHGLSNIHADGTLVSSDTTQVIPQPMGPPPSDSFFTTSSLGAWKATKDGYSATHTELLVNPDSSLLATCTTQWTIKLGEDGNSFDGTAVFRCVASSGQVDRPARFPITGQRVQVADE